MSQSRPAKGRSRPARSQPRPARGGAPAQPGPQPPGPVRAAVGFMYAGAAVSVVTAVLSVAAVGTVRDLIRQAHPHFTAAQVNAGGQTYLIESLGLTVVEVFLWLFLARACRNGMNWGRVTGTVMFALNTLALLVALALPGSIGIPHSVAGVVLTVLLWLAGLGAVVMLWRRESTAYFTGAGGS